MFANVLNRKGKEGLEAGALPAWGQGNMASEGIQFPYSVTRKVTLEHWAKTAFSRGGGMVKLAIFHSVNNTLALCLHMTLNPGDDPEGRH